MYPCHNYSELHSMKTWYFWIIYWEDCISLGPPLERWHAGAVVGLSRLCAQAASLQGQTAFCIFMAGFTTGKWSFPGHWGQWRGWSGTTEGPSAQHEMFKTAWRCLILRNGAQHLSTSQFSRLVCQSHLYSSYTIQNQIFRDVLINCSFCGKVFVAAVVYFRKLQRVIYSTLRASGLLESDAATVQIMWDDISMKGSLRGGSFQRCTISESLGVTL